MVHAARSRRWRGRHRHIEPVAARPAADAKFVTHQGSPGDPGDAPLLAWTNDHAEASITTHTIPSAATLVAHAAGPTCRRCGATLTPWVRQGFLRRSVSARVTRHDHSP
jgi:hypothetical protein